MKLLSMLWPGRASKHPVASPRAEPPMDTAQAWKIKRILLIEDEADQRVKMRVFLEGKGFECRSAADCRQAMELARQEPFDLDEIEISSMSLGTDRRPHDCEKCGWFCAQGMEYAGSPPPTHSGSRNQAKAVLGSFPFTEKRLIPFL